MFGRVVVGLGQIYFTEDLIAKSSVQVHVMTVVGAILLLHESFSAMFLPTGLLRMEKQCFFSGKVCGRPSLRCCGKLSIFVSTHSASITSAQE